MGSWKSEMMERHARYLDHDWATVDRALALAERHFAELLQVLAQAKAPIPETRAHYLAEVEKVRAERDRVREEIRLAALRRMS